MANFEIAKPFTAKGARKKITAESAEAAGKDGRF
jgi:hypothetical protein